MLLRLGQINRLVRPSTPAGQIAVPYRFRSSFLAGMLGALEAPRGALVVMDRGVATRDWAAERTDHPREVIEAALAHVVQNKVEAAYARSDLFDRRRLMDDWSICLAGGGR